MNLTESAVRSFWETIKQHHFALTKSGKKNENQERRNSRRSATREELKRRKRKVFVSHVSQVKLLIVDVDVVVFAVVIKNRGIKIAHFLLLLLSHFVAFCPPPKMHHALWILNSNHYASTTGRQTQESWSVSTDIAECEMLVMAIHGFRFSFAPFFFHRCFSHKRGHLSRQYTVESSASRIATEDGIFSLCFTKHHTFPFCNSHKFAKCRFGGCEF